MSPLLASTSSPVKRRQCLLGPDGITRGKGYYARVHGGTTAPAIPHRSTRGRVRARLPAPPQYRALQEEQVSTSFLASCRPVHVPSWGQSTAAASVPGSPRCSRGSSGTNETKPSQAGLLSFFQILLKEWVHGPEYNPGVRFSAVSLGQSLPLSEPQVLRSLRRKVPGNGSRQDS